MKGKLKVLNNITLKWIICFCSFLTSFASADKLSIMDIYRNIKLNRSKMVNFQCNVEYKITTSQDFQKKTIEALREKGLPKRKIKNLLNNLTNFQEVTETMQFQTLAFDTVGRSRVEIIFSSNNSKQDSAVNIKHISTWDGKNSIQYVEPSGKSPSALIGITSPFESSKDFKQPWRQFGGNFCDKLLKAINNKSKIDVDELSNGIYRIRIYEKNKISLSVIDTSKGFSLILQETYINNNIAERYQADYQEISNGIWFPITGIDERYSSDRPKTLEVKSIMKISNIKLNGPVFTADMFHVEFPKGTYVVDTVSGTEFIVGEPGSQRLSGVAHETANQIADKQIEKFPNIISTTQPELKKKLERARKKEGLPIQTLSKDLPPVRRSYSTMWLLLPIVLFLVFWFIKRTYKH